MKIDWLVVGIAGVIIFVSLLDLGLNALGFIPYVGALLESFTEFVLEVITIIGVLVLAVKHGVKKK